MLLSLFVILYAKWLYAIYIIIPLMSRGGIKIIDNIWAYTKRPGFSLAFLSKINYLPVFP
jgi:hypothetical protein